ncbi:MAG: hypothetical protein AB7R40_23205 [Nitrospiraceae bacterium]
MKDNIGTLVAIIVLAVVLAFASGALTIWTLNALFGLGISYSIKTIFAAAVLATTVYGAGAKSKS